MSFSVGRTTKHLLRGLLATKSAPSKILAPHGLFRYSRITKITINDKARTIAFCIESKRGFMRVYQAFTEHYTISNDDMVICDGHGTVDDLLTALACTRHRFDTEVLPQIMGVLDIELDKHLANKFEMLVQGLYVHNRYLSALTRFGTN